MKSNTVNIFIPYSIQTSVNNIKMYPGKCKSNITCPIKFPHLINVKSPLRNKTARFNSIEDFLHGYSLSWELEAISITCMKNENMSVTVSKDFANNVE